MSVSSLRVLVTRPQAQVAEFEQALLARGFVPVACPTLATAPVPLSDTQRSQLCQQLPQTDWLVFTSINGVWAWQALAHEVRQLLPATCRVAVTGPGTAQVAEAAGLPVTICPAVHTGQAVAEALIAHGAERVLALRAQEARPELPTILAQHGIALYDLAIYTTTYLPAPAHIPSVDVITFTSPSAVKAFAQWGEPAHQRAQAAHLAVIGPTTAATCQQVFGRVDLQADPYTLGGLMDALATLTDGGGSVCVH